MKRQELIDLLTVNKPEEIIPERMDEDLHTVLKKLYGDFSHGPGSIHVNNNPKIESTYLISYKGITEPFDYNMLNILVKNQLVITVNGFIWQLSKLGYAQLDSQAQNVDADYTLLPEDAQIRQHVVPISGNLSYARRTTARRR